MSLVHVAVAVISNSQNEVLLALRQAHQHQGGLWEFPGGKVDDNESVYEALVREIKEEVALDIVRAEPLVEVRHDYDDKSVLLDVWHITEYRGKEQGIEGQKLQWCTVKDLENWSFPKANETIIELLQSNL